MNIVWINRLRSPATG